jgi:hypothetical protein
MNYADIILLGALVLTILIEFVVLWIAFRKPLHMLGYSALINGLTLPAAYIIDTFLGFYVTEVIVFIAEVFLIKLLLQPTYKKAVIVSLVANLITAFISFVALMF